MIAFFKPAPQFYCYQIKLFINDQKTQYFAHAYTAQCTAFLN